MKLILGIQGIPIEPREVRHKLDKKAYLAFFQTITTIGVILISLNINIVPVFERSYKKYTSELFHLKILDSMSCGLLDKIHSLPAKVHELWCDPINSSSLI